MALKAILPIVSQELEEDHAASPDSEGGAYDFSTYGGDSLVMPQMVDLASQGLRHLPRLAGQKRLNYAYSVLKKCCAFGMVLAATMLAPSNVFSHAMPASSLLSINVLP